MKTLLLGFACLLFAGPPPAHAQAQLPSPTPPSFSKEEQALLALSKTKWTWMADKNTEALNGLFEENCVFVHMGGSWGKNQELSIIKGGMIWYKKAEVYSAAVNIFGTTAILLNDIDLVALVGGKEAINPFMVTEVYLKKDGKWQLGSLTFSHLARPLKLPGTTTPPPH